MSLHDVLGSSDIIQTAHCSYMLSLQASVLQSARTDTTQLISNKEEYNRIRKPKPLLSETLQFDDVKVPAVALPQQLPNLMRGSLQSRKYFVW